MTVQEQTHTWEQQQVTSAKTDASEASAAPHRYEQGRRYHNRDDVAYVLPDDDDENDRVHQQHWLFRTVFDGNFSSPVLDDLENGILVHDAGCGPGTWTLEMAQTYTNSTFYGTDVSTRFPEAIKPRNCLFQVHNLLDIGGFPENHFGFIHQRVLMAGILEKDWQTVINEHTRTLAPGGWLECLETSLMRPVNSGPKSMMMQNMLIGMLKARGLFAEVGDHLEEMFKRAGLINVQIKEVPVSLAQDTKIGLLAWEDVRDAMIALKPIVMRTSPELADHEKFLAFMEEIGVENHERQAKQIFLRVFGQKPLTGASQHSD